MSGALTRFNRLEAAEAEQELLACCASSRWAAAVAAARPFADLESLIRFGESTWAGLRPEDWLEAFAAHPWMGERPDGGSDRSLVWSEEELAVAAEEQGRFTRLRLRRLFGED